MTPYPFSTSSLPSAHADLKSGLSSAVRAEPNTATSRSGNWLISSNDSTNSDMIRKIRQESTGMKS